MVARIGVVGAGWWATRAHLPAIVANRDADLVAIADPIDEKRDRAASVFHPQRVYPGHREMPRERGSRRRRDRSAPHGPLRGGQGCSRGWGPSDVGEAHGGGVGPRRPAVGGVVGAEPRDRRRLSLPLQPAGAVRSRLDRVRRDRRAALCPLAVRLDRVGAVPRRYPPGGRRGRVHDHTHGNRHLRRPGDLRRRPGHRADHPLGPPCCCS